jgi:hypothetical protein
VEVNFLWLALGAGLLLWGKKLFWVFVGAAGFLFGLSTSQSLLDGQPFWLYLVIAAICAAIVVAGVKFLKNVAFGLGGFILGAYLAYGVLQMFNLELGVLQWVILIGAGALGAVLMLTLFDWALILLSTTVGSLIITRSIPGEAPGIQILFFGLILIGIIAQMRKSHPAPQIVGGSVDQ